MEYREILKQLDELELEFKRDLVQAQKELDLLLKIGGDSLHIEALLLQISIFKDKLNQIREARELS